MSAQQKALPINLLEEFSKTFEHQNHLLLYSNSFPGNTVHVTANSHERHSAAWQKGPLLLLRGDSSTVAP